MAYIENDSSNDRCNGCGRREHACRCGCPGENSIWFGGEDVGDWNPDWDADAEEKVEEQIFAPDLEVTTQEELEAALDAAEADRWEMVRFDCDTGSRVAIIYDEKLQIYNCSSNDPDFGTVAYNNGVLAASTVNELKRKLKKLELQTSGRKSELVQRLVDTGLVRRQLRLRHTA